MSSNALLKRQKPLVHFLGGLAILLVAGGLILWWMKSVPGLQYKIVNSTPVFYYSKYFIIICHHLLSLCGYSSTYNLLCQPTGEYVYQLCTPDPQCLYLAWPCFGVKLTGVFIAFIMVFPGKFCHKFWFIPVGILLIQVFNIIRFTGLMAFLFHYPILVVTNFEFLDLGIGYHELFNMVLYFLIFALLVVYIRNFSYFSTTKKP